ncbi:MAG: M23 family metallopeptidase [Dethiobacter sp.]|jgi:murein DD-endopeptidase MepM/ murein hydrolase activator NlpD|nr:M23 family metallopeptidase [Dethiobacter sp.]
MKKNIAPKAALRKIRLGRRGMILLIYFLMIGLMIAFVAWRGVTVTRLELPPPVSETGAAETDAEPDVAATAPSVPVDEDYVADTTVEEENPAPVVSAPSGPMLWPVEGEILIGHHESYYIGSVRHLHVGVDIAAEAGTVVAAAWPGVVIDVRAESALGLMVEIDHGGGFISLYGNLYDVFVNVDDIVEAGQAIAEVGQTARLDAGEGYFLHFALYRDGRAVDPVRELSPR